VQRLLCQPAIHPRILRGDGAFCLFGEFFGNRIELLPEIISELPEIIAELPEIIADLPEITAEFLDFRGVLQGRAICAFGDLLDAAELENRGEIPLKALQNRHGIAFRAWRLVFFRAWDLLRGGLWHIRGQAL